MKKALPFIAKTLITAVIYAALLLPFQMNLQIFDGTDIRPSAFIPIVLGIFWELPAAIGIFIGNLACDIICYNTSFVILGSIINGLSALCARQIFFASWNHPMTRGQYIYSLGSLVNFIFTVFIVELSVACPISIILHFYSGAPILPAFEVIFLNNVHSNVFFGIPAMLFLPLLNRWATQPHGEGSIKRFIIANSLLIASIIPVIIFIIADLEWNILWAFVCTIPMLGAILTSCATPTIERDQALYGFKSIKTSTFRKMMIMAILTSIIVCILITYDTGKTSPSLISNMTKAYKLCAMVELFYLVIFALGVKMVERNLVNPLHSVASKLSLKGETYKNELDIISKRLDFVASSGTEHLSNDEYSIIIGLTKKDNSGRFSIPEARMLINDICLKHVTGYISAIEGVGGYKGEEHSGMEQMLIYTIYGASDGQIKEIADDIITQMSQESVLIEKNRLIRYYYYGAE